MEHLDAATLEEFQAFNKKFYSPSNAVLVVTGDIDIPKTKQLIESYFADIPSGTPIVKQKFEEAPITKTIIDTAYDSNIQIPAIMTAYRVPGMLDKDGQALEMASAVLSSGSSSRMYKKMVDDKQNSLQVGTFNYALEDYGMYISYALPNGDAKLDSLLIDMDEEIVKLQTDLISDDEFKKLQNRFESEFLDKNRTMLGLAENLADGFTFYKNTNNLNTELEKIRKVTKEDIRAVAKKYLNPNQRVILYYLPKTK
jgi:zinc protease